MNKVMIFRLLLILFIGYSSNRIYSEVEPSQIINVKIRAGVVMKSGDIKNIARQDLLILKADLISIWVKKYQVEKDIKANSKYEQKMAFYQNNINKINKDIVDKSAEINNILSDKSVEINKFISDISAELSHIIADNSAAKSQIIKSVTSRLKQNLEISFELGKRWGVQEAFERLKSYYVGDYNYLLSCIKDVEKKYLELLKRNFTDEYVKTFNNQYEDFKVIIKLLDEINTADKDELERKNKIAKERDIFTKELNKYIGERDSSIEKIDKERDVFIKEMNNNIKTKKEEVELEFQNKLKENYVLAAKTNLNGETSFTVTKGDYFIFFIAEIAENKIIWNYHVALSNDNQYIELSNDNAYSIGNKELVHELSVAIYRAGIFK